MRLFLDECLSPRLALDLQAEGRHLVIHPRNNGGLGDPDHAVLRRCTEENLVIVTENAGDFRSLAARADIHPGMILLPCMGRQTTERLIETAIATSSSTTSSKSMRPSTSTSTRSPRSDQRSVRRAFGPEKRP